jgi:hypothetical protein
VTLADVVVYVVVTAFLSWGLGRAVTLAPINRIARPNYRGVNLNPMLGLTVAASALGVVVWSLIARALAGRWEERFGVYLWVLGACLIVLAAGFLDDLSEGGVRGLKGHLESALRGRPTTGSVKVLAGIVAGALAVTGLPARPSWVMIAGVVMMAGCTNIWNDLDVAPGRAGRAFLLFGLVVPFISATSAPQALMFVLVFAELPALRYDLLEKAMLGDAGANLLGLVVGMGLYAVLPDWAVAVAAVLAIGLNLVAETVTFSKVIASVFPLRWFDQLGTSPEWRTFSANGGS